MEPEILTLTTGQREEVTVRAGPSATLDLIYACYLLERLERRPTDAPAWATELRERAPERVAATAALAAGEEGSGKLVLTFGLALESDAVWDATPERFVADLPRLAAEMRDAVAAGDLPTMPDHLQRFVRETEPDVWAGEVADVLGPLWSEIADYWQREGRPKAEAAARDVEARFREHGDVVRALPSHHFAQFEALAAELRSEAERGALHVVPLALASGGGFHLSSATTAALGFGLASEDIHARTEERVASVARRAKALADPTRLMLLSLLARYASSSSLTVGDLARQLGVSQPTVSGHLKTLREAELIRVEKKGNRSLPRLEGDAVRDLLDALDDVLHRPDLS